MQTSHESHASTGGGKFKADTTKKFFSAILIAGLLLTGCGAEKNSPPVVAEADANCRHKRGIFGAA